MSVEKPPYYYNPTLKQIKCFYYRNLLLTLDILKTKGAPIDISASCKGANYKVAYTDGTVKYYYTWTTLFSKIEEDFGIKLAPQGSKKFGVNTYILTLLEPLVLNSEEVSSEGNTDVSEAIQASPEEPQEEVVSEEEENLPKEEIQEVDYDYLNSLYDEEEKAESKNKLEAYVIEKYGIDLRKNQSFQNMIKELEDKLLEG
jgi:hypothetical protein